MELVVAKSGRGGPGGPLVANGCPQGEGGAGTRAAGADRGGIDDEVGGRCGAHGQGHGRRAVVSGIGFSADALDAGSVVVGALAGGGAQADRLGAGAVSGQAADTVGPDFGVAGGNGRVGGPVVAQGGRGGAAGSLVADSGPQGEGGPGARAAGADRRGLDDQVGSRCGAHGQGHGRRAVVSGIGFSADALDAGSVVVGALAGGGAQADRLGAGAGSRQAADTVGPDFGVAGGNGGVGGAVVAQGGRAGAGGSLVADSGPQGEGGAGRRAAGADRRGLDDQVGSRCGAHGQGHGRRAVVSGIGFSADALDAGSVVVGALAGGGAQADRLGAGAGSGQAADQVGADLGVAGGDGGVGGAVVAQGGRARPAGTLVADRGPQGEGGPGRRAAGADRGGIDDQVGGISAAPSTCSLSLYREGIGLQDGLVGGPPQFNRTRTRRAAGQVDLLTVLARQVVLGFRRTVVGTAAGVDLHTRGGSGGVGHHLDRLAGLDRKPVPGPVVLEGDGGGKGRQRCRPLDLALPDSCGQRRIGGIDRVGGDVIGVGEIRPAVPVDVTEGDIAVVRHDEAGIGAVHGNQQGVENVDPAVVVDVAEDPSRGRLRTQDRARSLDDDVHRSHARLHPEGRVEVGDQPFSRDGQSVDRVLLHLLLPDGGWRTTRHCRRNPGLPVDQHHAPGQVHPAALQPVEVDPCGRRTPRGIRGVPAGGVKAGRTFPVDQGRHPLSQDVEDLEPHPGRGRQLVWNYGGRIERIGIVVSQLEPLGQNGHPRPPERQCEVARLIGGRDRRRQAQVGQVEQQHLRRVRRFPGGQPHPALHKGLRSCLQVRQNPNETADCNLHEVSFPVQVPIRGIY